MIKEKKIYNFNLAHEDADLLSPIRIQLIKTRPKKRRLMKKLKRKEIEDETEVMLTGI